MLPLFAVRRQILYRRRIRRHIRLDGYHLLRQLRQPPQIRLHHNPALGQQPAAVRPSYVLHQRPPHDVRVGVLDFGHDAAIRRLYEPELIRARVSGERPQQPDVRAFGRLNRADAPVVRVMHIAHIKPRALPGQPARPQRRQPPLVRQLRKRVRLVHKLRQLRPAEELAHRGDHGPYVYQRRRRSGIRIYLRGHSLFDNALHTHQPNADLVLYQLAHRPHAPVAQVVDVVRRYHPVVYQDHMPYQLNDVLRLQHAQLGIRLPAQAAVQLMPTHAPQVVAPLIVKQVGYQLIRVFLACRLARPQPAIELHHRLVLRGNARVPIYRRAYELVVGVGVHIREQLQDLVVGAVAHRPQQRADRRLALAVHLDRNQVAVAGLELHPSAAIRDKLGGGKPPARIRVRLRREIHARRAHKLAHHHALSAVYHERPVDGHHRDVPHEQRLLLDLPARRYLQRHRHIQRRGIGNLFLAALLLAELRLLEVMVAQRQLEPLARRILYRRNLLEQIPQPVRHKPVKRIPLNLYQVRHRQHGIGGGIRLALAGGADIPIGMPVARADIAVPAAVAVLRRLVKPIRNSGCGHALTLLALKR